MKRLIVLAALAVLLAARADAECGPLHGVASVDMATDRYGRMTIPVTLAGQHRRMLVDTGAYITSLTPEAVTDLGLETSHTSMTIEDILGNRSDHLAIVPTMTLGRLSSDQVKLFILPGPPQDADTAQSHGPDEVAGIFGSDYMRNYDIDLDFGAKKFRLISPDHCEGKVVYWRPQNFSIIPMTISKNNDIILPMKLDGEDIKALIDTGADQATMDGRLAKRLFGLEPDPKGAEVINGERVAGIIHHTFKALEIEGLTISNIDVDIVPDVASTKETMDETSYRRTVGGDDPYQLILGMKELRQLHIYIAYRERKLYISPAMDAALPAHP